VFADLLKDLMAKTSDKGDVSVHLITKDNEAELRPVADRLARESEYDCYFDPQDPIDPHTFVGFLGSVPAGYLLVDRGINHETVPIEHALPDWLKPEFPGSLLPVWKVCVVWVKPCFHKQRLGSQLCLAACSHFNTTPHEIGWSMPISEAGQALLQSLGVRMIKLA
jgi:hypothetical protein